MSKKTVCDICVADANDTQYTVPFYKSYYAENDGIKLAKFDRMEACELNFCDYHRNLIACLLKSLRDTRIKG